jgi:hypothetical protein
MSKSPGGVTKANFKMLALSLTGPFVFLSTPVEWCILSWLILLPQHLVATLILNAIFCGSNLIRTQISEFPATLHDLTDTGFVVMVRISN